MNSAGILLESSKAVLGNDSSDNTLKITFTPPALFAEDGRGSITMDIPNWYEASRQDMMFDAENVQDQCTSEQLNIFESRLDIDGQYLLIRFNNLDSAFTDEALLPITSQIIIECKGFKNPIYQSETEWDGFVITIRDSES